MKNILIFSFLAIILISSSVSISNVDAQQGSRDLTAEYCINNWQRDPVQCANYVPEDYDQNKALYSAQEAEKARQESQKIIQSKQNEQRVCSLGSHVTTDSQGNQICVDSSGRFTGYPNISETSESDGSEIGVGIFVFIIIIVVIIAIKKKSGSTGTQDYRDVKRKDFSFQTKEMVKIKQLGKCKRCGRIPTHWEFDHIAGRGDNSIGNCQGLCRDCHMGKTLNDNW